MTLGAGVPDPGRREPLWDRVDRNRIRLALYIALFVVGSVVALDLYVVTFAGCLGAFILFRFTGTVPTMSASVRLMAVVSLMGAAAATAWATYALSSSERWLVKRLEAVRVPRGELMDTKFALKDMAIAAGLPMAPELFVIEAAGVNAFILARKRRAVIGVTTGMLERLDLSEQRAVFANLVARLISGDALVATALTALLWPLQSWRMRPVPEDRLFGPGPRSEAPVVHGSGGDASVLFALLLTFGIGFALVAEVVAAAHRRSQLTASEKADAEGMLLLKDPVSMLSALERCVDLDNLVPNARDTLGELFYCWPSFSTNDEDDPEWARVARLREVLGVMGMPARSRD